jgi:mannose/cellobiose epimerase-like protein (N-acyl-D-glucosamine 2-epimerase family)
MNTTSQFASGQQLLQDCAGAAKDWLFNAAAPLWSSAGVLADRLFAEALSQTGAPVHKSRRLRVQARQIYAFCEIGQLGWQGPWHEAAARALDRLLAVGRRGDGFFVHLIDEQGAALDTRADLYDHAFVLLALAHASRALGRGELISIANELMDRIDARWKNPGGGYNEGEVNAVPPRWQNPHMHLFEAVLALESVTRDARWHHISDSLFKLFSNVFFDPASGAMREYYTLDWKLATDEKLRLVEPGHCFEWAWLLHRVHHHPSAAPMADRLIAFARNYGIDRARNVAVNEIQLDGAPRDRSARLWPQTERLKAALARWQRTGEVAEAREAETAYRGLVKYFDTPTRGTWRDRLRADGSFVEEDAPASSFYHIVCALSELIRAGAPHA